MCKYVLMSNSADEAVQHVVCPGTKNVIMSSTWQMSVYGESMKKCRHVKLMMVFVKMSRACA